jgi:hypothetical protein
VLVFCFVLLCFLLLSLCLCVVVFSQKTFKML